MRMGLENLAPSESTLNFANLGTTMKFDNAFLTATNHVGMQFTNKRRQVFSVYEDVTGLHFSEGFSKEDTEKCITYYERNKEKYRA